MVFSRSTNTTYERRVAEMSPKSVDDYIQEGIYGARDLNKSEHALFLGSLRERAELALTTGQTITNRIYPQVEKALQTESDLEMLLNGDIAYPHLSKYIKLSNQYHIPFTIVQNEQKETPIGLLLAHKTAIDKHDIFITDDIFHEQTELR